MYYLVWQTVSDYERKSHYYCLRTVRKLEEAIEYYAYRRADFYNVYLFTTVDEEVKKDIKLHSLQISDSTLYGYRNKIYLLKWAGETNFLIS